MDVRIYQPARATTQSGLGKTHCWLLEAEPTTPRRPEPLMGWVSSGDTLNQIRMVFESRQEAVTFAERKGWDYAVCEPHQRRVKPKNYTDNFRTDRPNAKFGA